MRVPVLLPQPHQLETTGSGRFRFPEDGLSVALRGLDETATRRCLDALQRQGWQPRRVAASGPAALVLACDPALPKPARCRDDARDEAYVLEVSAEGIALTSVSARGLFHGIQTLVQLRTQAPDLPCVRIADWPDMPFRGQHLTLGSGHMPTLPLFKDLIDTLALFKSNTLMLEYDDRFPFERHPVLANPNALTKDEIRELIAYAAGRYIDIIPLLDSLGHAEHYLKHPEYRHLAELPGQTAELCPSNPATLAFIKELWSEILEVHAGCSHAHITGDEVFRLDGFCPACRPHAEAGRLGELYTRYYVDLSRWILERGRRPILWADMAARFPVALAQLPREAVMNDWYYQGMDAYRLSTTQAWGHGPVDRATFAEVPEPLRTRLAPYLFHASTAPDPTPFPYVRFLQDQGFEVIGASASSGHPPQIAASFRDTISNNKYFARAVGEAGARGLLCSHWSGHVGIFACLHGVAAGGAYSWHYHDEPRDAFLDGLQQVLLRSGRKGGLAQVASIYEFTQRCAGGFVTGAEESSAPAVEAESLELLRDCAAPSPGNHYAAFVELSAEMARLVLDYRQSCNHRFLARIGQGGDVPLDLGEAVNIGLKESVHVPGLNLAPMGQGLQTAWGVPFRLADPAVRGGKTAVGTWGEAVPDRPRQVRIPVEGAFTRLFFLHTVAYSTPGAVMARIRMHYAEGAPETFEVVNGRNMFDWHRGPFNLPDAVIAWERLSAGDSGTRKLAYLSWWDNPRPAVPLRAIEVLAAEEPGYHILVAVTGRTSPLPAAPRPEDEAATRADLARRIEALKGRLLAAWRKVTSPADAEKALASITARLFDQMV